MIRRNIEDKVRMALADTPVVFLTGARQTGKTTLVRQIAKDLPGAGYISLDDLSAFALASANPQGFLENLPRPVILDEVQKAPVLFDAIKREVDRNHTPGQFLLTGSAHLLTIPALSRALVGRVEILPLFPFSQGELVGRKEHWLDRVFAEGSMTLSSDRLNAKALAERLVLGGYPAAVQRSTANRREAWFASYLTTLLQRDVRDLSRIEGLGALPNLLSLVAARSASLLNVAELARSSGLPATTLNRYFALLEGLFLVIRVPAWSRNLTKRLTRAPKIQLIDSGVACYLLGLDAQGLQGNTVHMGPLLENFVAVELMKQISWSDSRASLYHYRTMAGKEVDFVLEDRGGGVVGIEVKLAASVQARDFLGLRSLQETAGAAFVRGVVLYLGEQILPAGERLWAVPLAEMFR